MDLLIILLIANGCHFHVERVHEVPHIVHAVDFKDLQDTNLASKIEFLKRNRLTKTSKFIDRELRNAIAHLTYKMDDKGEISIKRENKWKKVNIHERINTFTNKFSMILLILGQEGLGEISKELFAE